MRSPEVASPGICRRTPLIPSFTSQCVLALVPVYLAYAADDALLVVQAFDPEVATDVLSALP